MRSALNKLLMLREGLVTYRSTMIIILIALASCFFSGAEGQAQRKQNSQDAIMDVGVTVNADRIVHVTDERFLSVAFTIGDMRNHWREYNLRSIRLQTLAKGLCPSYLRLGGSRADFATFRENLPDAKLENHFRNFTFTGQDWDQINNFSQAVGWLFMFDVNEFLRKNGRWDPSNLEALLDYNTMRNYTVTAWQIGNEPNAYQHAEGVTITAQQVAQDYVKLRDVLNSRMQYADPFLFGPDVTHPRNKLGVSSVKFLQGFLAKCGDCTNVTSFHSYYLSAHTAKLDDFINPSTLDALKVQIREITDVVKMSRPQVPPRIWLTETGDSVPGGISGISDRYVGGIPFLDKLGVSAQQGLEAIMKQQFIGRFVGLVNETNINPRPVYWVAYLHKKLVGRRVLNVTTNQQEGNTLRIYAHCTQTNHSKYSPGDVTMMALNLDKAKSIQLNLQGHLANSDIDEYLLTPSGDDGLHARYVNLNDVKLEMMNDTRLPELKPRTLLHPQAVTLPPLTYAFYVIPKANFKVCM